MNNIIRFTQTHVVVLCSLGHLMTACKLTELAGSMFEVLLQNPERFGQCDH